MGKDTLFRTCVFGGYNKQDVNEYIEKLEEQLNKAKILNQENNQGKKVDETDFFVLKDDETQHNPKEQPIFDKKENSFDEYMKLQEQLIQTKEQLSNVKEELKEKNNKCEQLQMELNQLKNSSENYEEDYKAVKNVLLNARVDAEIIVAKAREKAKMITEDSQKKLTDKKKDMISLILKSFDENSESLNISKSCLETQIKSLVIAQKQMESMKKELQKDYITFFDEDTGDTEQKDKK